MKSRSRDTFRIFWQYSKKYKLVMFVMVVSQICAIAISTYIPFLYKDFFDLLATGSTAVAPELFSIVVTVFIYGLVLVLFWRIAEFTTSRFQPRVMRDIMNAGFESIHLQSYRFFSNNFSGSLVRWLGRFENAFEKITDQLYWHIGHLVVRTLFILGFLLFIEPIFAYVIFLWSVIYIGLVYGYTKFKYKFNVQEAAQDSQVVGRLADTVVNSVNIKTFAGFHREGKSFGALVEKLYKIRRFIWELDTIGDAVKATMFVVLELVVFYFAIKLWQRGQITIGDFALLQAYLVAILGHLWDLGRNIRDVYENLAKSEEMTEVFLSVAEIRDIDGAKKLEVTKGHIDFKKIKFGYHKDEAVLNKFDLKIKSGERVALIGPSGGGKSTIIKLLFRFFDIQGGKIEIDGQDISKVTQDSLRSSVGMVPQDPILFHRTLFENIRYGKPSASKKEVVEAAKLAHAHEFISKFPKGYKTFVGERGVKLSGGERQRVAIARAILKNAPILVLDEATSSLDSESEMFIQDALKKLMKGRTTIVVAHRLSTIMQMDRIVVIENGRIKEQGKHEELLKVKQGIYQKLWEIQAGGFETS